MEQAKIGKFIASMRKNKNMTQKELAEKLGLSDKAVSKWETGNGLPDTGSMIELCRILGISVNDLLSGECLSTEEYSKRAEENMMRLIEETNEVKKKNENSILVSAVGCAVLVILFVLMTAFSGGSGVFVRIFDIVPIVMIFSVCAIMLIISRLTGDFVTAIKYFWGLEKELSKIQIGKAIIAVKTVVYASAATALMETFLSGILVLMVTELQKIGPYIAIVMISLLYSTIVAFAMLPTYIKLKKAQIERREF